jgi:DNA-3-methyladenine glycosylase II
MTTFQQTVIRPTKPYRLDLALQFLQTSPTTIVETVNDESYQRVFLFAGQPVLVSLRQISSPDDPQLEVALEGKALNEAILQQAVHRLGEIFHLFIDPQPFEVLLEQDPVLKEKSASWRGLRPVLIGDPFESLLWSIIGQQVNITFAKKLKQALLRLCNQNLILADQSYPLPPQPEQILALGEDKLRSHQFSRQKTQYLLIAAQAVAQGTLNFAQLRQLPFEQACQNLMQWKGIGRWTAESVLMRGLGFPDIVPAGDLGLQTIVGQLYKKGERASEKEVREIAQTYQPWRSWLTFLWMQELQKRQMHRQRRANQ